MALSTLMLSGLLAMSPGNPLGDMPAYWDAMESANAQEAAQEQVADALTRHVRSFQAARRQATTGLARGGPQVQVRDIRIQGDHASAVLQHSDRSEFVQLIRSNQRWLVVPPERERRDP
jgi:hypothetical protein